MSQSVVFAEEATTRVSEDNLVAASKRGDVEAFGALFERHKGACQPLPISCLLLRQVLVFLTVCIDKKHGAEGPVILREHLVAVLLAFAREVDKDFSCVDVVEA